jgi:hypothetical protein
MTRLRQSGIALLLSILIGALCGVLIILLSDPPTRIDEIPGFFIILFWATVFSLPYVGMGLILLGLPATWLLHRYLLEPWFGLIAATWGGVAGSLVYYWYNSVQRGGSNELAELTGIQQLGLVYGVPTGLAWWLFYRRVLVKREVVGSP